MTPHQLHAQANLIALKAVWGPLLRAARRAAGASGDDRGTVQAWRPGSGVHSGRTGDQILDAILRETEISENPYQARADRTHETMLWLAKKLEVPVMPYDDAIGALVEVVHLLRPATALELAMWAGAEDRAIRQLLREPADRARLAGINCPRCDTAGTLVIRTANPSVLDRPVICEAPGCSLDGVVPSIWTRDQIAAELDPPQAAA